MWNNVAESVKNRSTRRLALAILVSVILHAYLVGGFSMHLPVLKKEVHTLETRLQMPKAAVPEEKIQQEAKVKKNVVSTRPNPVATLPQTPQVLADVIEEPVPADQEQQADEVPETLSTTELEQAAEPLHSEELESDPQPIDMGLVINENAYQYVETDFVVRTEIDGVTQGSAKVTYDLIDNQQYMLKSVIKPRGLAALVLGDLVQTSDGTLTKNGLRPDFYLYQYNNKADKTYSAKFDWTSKVVSLTTAKGTKTAEIMDGTQDLLSFMYQFMYVAPLERMQISVATGKKLNNYDYRFDGEENISIPLGELKTLHISHIGDNDDEKTELWLAIDYQYVPVKIRKTEKNGKLYELAAKHINTARPTVLN